MTSAPALDPGPREKRFRILQLAVIGSAALLFLLELPSIPAGRFLELAFFIGLATLAFRLRVRYAGNFLGLEAAAIVPVVLLFDSPGAAILVCVAADVLAKLLRRTRRLTLSTAFDLSQLALSYGLSARFFHALAQPPAGPAAVAVAAAMVLLVFFFINTALVFGYLELGKLVPTDRLLGMGVFQLVALLLVVPIVVLEILTYNHYGVIGLLLAFFPVVLTSLVLRGFSTMEEKYARVARENRELEVMREVSNIFSLGARPDRYRRAFEALRKLLPVEAMAFVEWLDDAEEAIDIHLEGSAAVSREEIRDWVRRRRLDEALDVTAESVWPLTGGEREVALSPVTRHQLVARLSTYELHTGLLVLESSYPALHAPSSIASLRALAGQMALVLQDRAIRAQVHELSIRNRERAETLGQILEISNEVKRHLTPDNLFQSIVTAVGRSLGFDAVLLSLYVPERDLFVRRAQYGLDHRWAEIRGQEVPSNELTRHWTERHRVSKSYFVRERTSDELTRFDVVTARPRRPVSNGWRPYDMLFIPLHSGESLVGCLSVDEPRNGQAPTLETIQALEIFANQAVTAIENARRYHDAKEQSIRDGLTGAYNHRHFQETLQRELGRADRQSRTLSVLMLDIDDFKAINDRYGHPVGDAILERIVAEIRSEVRGDMDLVARYGGEEFAVILPETPTEVAVEVAERIRRKIDERLFRPPEGEDVIRVTVSIGLAAYPNDASNKKELVERADAALYRAKRRGKNAVVMTGRPDDEPMPTLPH
ncbi:MAG TPA: sensor domain-containing diguanylate cyclase [Thermoanaerobaculia bacterium]|jgi:diguanylate cyclase (GGDEF)-like protein